MAAVNQSSVPWCTFLVRNVFGVAGAVNQPVGPVFDPLCLAVGALGLVAAGRRHRGRLPRRDRRRPRPAAKRAEIEERLNQLRSPFRTAETFWIEEIIDPRDTRRLSVEFASLAEKLREPGERRSACGRESFSRVDGSLRCGTTVLMDTGRDEA